VNSTQSERPLNSTFEFVQALAGELSAGNVELPSFPEIAVRVRRVLADAESTSAQVVRVVGSEPALAAIAAHFEFGVLQPQRAAGGRRAYRRQSIGL
jgi:hypothetical protein